MVEFKDKSDVVNVNVEVEVEEDEQGEEEEEEEEDDYEIILDSTKLGAANSNSSDMNK